MAALADASVEQVDALRSATEMLVELERSIGQLLALKEGVLAVGAQLALQVAEEVGDEDFGDVSLRAVAAEFGAALRVSDRTVQRRMGEASWKLGRFWRVWHAQGQGRISAAHARVIMEAGEHLEDAAARDAYQEQMIAFAETESPNRVARMARRVAERFQPRPIEERHKTARERRSTWVRDREDGMAEFVVSGPAALIHGAQDRVSRMAHLVQSMTAGADDRTVAQLRCDLALDLLLTGDPAAHEATLARAAAAAASASVDAPDEHDEGAPRPDVPGRGAAAGAATPAERAARGGLLAAITAQISVTAPVLTLMGIDSTSAELDGMCPIDPETARRLAAAAPGWDRLLTHPITGGLLAVDRYRPSAQLRRWLRARDQRCRFPTCGRLAIDCDLDHHEDAALGGETSEMNLGDVCRRHHVLKHHSPWHVEPLGDGLYAWTSPTGTVYIDRPPQPATVTFTEDTPPPF